MFQKFCFLRLRSIFFSGALRHSTLRSLFGGFLDAPDSGLLHALLKLETPCLTIVESFRTVGCYCDHLVFPIFFL